MGCAQRAVPPSWWSELGHNSDHLSVMTVSAALPQQKQDSFLK